MVQVERTSGDRQSSMDLDDLFTRKSDRGSVARASEEFIEKRSEKKAEPRPEPQLKSEPTRVPERPKEKPREVSREKVPAVQASSQNQEGKSSSQNIEDALEKQKRREQAAMFLSRAKEAFDAKDYNGYLESLVNAAELKDPIALLGLGRHVAFGEFGLKADPVEGEKYVLSAIENGAGKAGKKFLDEIHEKFPKYFGMGKHLSSVLHIPSMIFGGLFAVIFITLFYLVIPILLIIARGNLWYWQVPEKTTVIPGGIWLLFSFILILCRFKKICKSYYNSGKKIFEFVVSNTFSALSIVIAIAFGIALCVGEYYLLTYLAGKVEFCMNHPLLTKVCKILVMVFSGAFVFYAGFLIPNMVSDMIKERANEYY